MIRLFLKILVLILLATFTLVAQTKPEASQKPILIKNVNIIPMTKDNRIIRNVNVVIKDNKILSINKPIPKDVEIIDGEGKWLIPGLIDMHIHGFADIDFGESYPTKGNTFFVDNQNVMALYVANGVTTILDLNARIDNFAQRNEIVRGNVIGPRIALAALINGGNESGRIANTPEDGRQTVRIAKAEGYDFIKVYSQLNIETYTAIVDEAERVGMKVVGHIPNDFQSRLEDAFIPNFGMVAHAEEFAKQSKDISDEDINRFVNLAKKNNTWLSPTLTVIKRILDQAKSLDIIKSLEGFEYIHPLMQDKWLTSNQYNKGTNDERIKRLERLVDFNNRLVKAFNKADIPIVSGTDAGSSGVIWGYSLHDEIENLTLAGLTNEEALVSATRLSATWLGIEDKIGTVEEGKFADLLLLDANPLDDIRNTRVISGVFVNGKWIDKEDINQMMMKVKKWNEENIEKYKWKDRKKF